MAKEEKLCPKCGTQNPVLRSTCLSCSTWLRGATIVEDSESATRELEKKPKKKVQKLLKLVVIILLLLASLGLLIARFIWGSGDGYYGP